ncbi:MAG: reverse transcriptase family protein [Bacilli bacterium]|nr:reverse transcriptase family protein [Bacilli bacterium]MDD4283013.1 reverse transcriptase family protein [Bacilli bacterium]
MDYTRTKLYGVTRKRDLKSILRHSLTKSFLKNANIKYEPFIHQKPKPRLIENPFPELKALQRRIKDLLFDLDFPENVFSGVKGKSYIDNGLYHIDCNYFIKIDLSKFFPNTHREKVFDFFFSKLKMNKDIAEVMTNLTTIDLGNLFTDDIKMFLKSKNIKVYNHLPSGSPISSIMSYLANIDMFNEIEKLCIDKDYKITFYVDDITISSKSSIDLGIVKEIAIIINNHYHKMNYEKLKVYNDSEYKKITGCVISANELIIPNKTRYKISKLIKEEYNEKELNRLLGLTRHAQLFDNSKYKSLEKTVKDKLKELRQSHYE